MMFSTEIRQGNRVIWKIFDVQFAADENNYTLQICLIQEIIM